MPSIHVIYASTSGHTEYVIDVLELQWKEAGVAITRQKAEESVPEDLLNADVLVLASSTWNTGSIEGQLNPHMHVLLKEKAKDIDLKGKQVALIALGDERYFYTARAGEHLHSFVESHGGKFLTEQLTIINESYGQEEKIRKWGKKFLTSIKSL